MLNITQFNLDKANRQLNVALNSDPELNDGITEQWLFDFEFLRVVSMNGFNAKQPAASHKKDIQLVAIESVAKHGYRFIFDDGFQVIYSLSELSFLHQQKAKLWQDYLTALAETGHNREASIDIKQL